MQGRFVAVVVFVALFCLSGTVYTQDMLESEEIVVTATRIETPSTRLGSSTTVITRREIERKGKATVFELLRTVPAVDVVQAGGPGRTTSVFIRGAKPEHTLVLIDGVEMNDPISPGRSYDLAHLTTDNIERIEIIRGPQSTLYGSDAMGGVINIITRKGEGRPGGFVSFEAGSFATFRERAGISGERGWMNYSIGFSRWDTEGISSAGEGYGNTEKDGYRNTSFSARLGLVPAGDVDVDFVVRYTGSEADIDNAGGRGGDDPNYTVDSEELLLSMGLRFLLLNDIWEQKFSLSLADHDRDYRNYRDADHPYNLSSSSYDGRVVEFDWQNHFYIHESNILTMGLESEKEEGESEYYSESIWGPYTTTFRKRSIRTTGYYLQDQISLWDSWFTTLGIRVDDNSRYGTKTTYRIASVYSFQKTGTRIRGSYGTGFKAPSLFQLFSRYGNEGLEPEESTGWDIGIEQSLPGGTILGVTYFHNTFEEMIEYDTKTSMYTNIAEAETRGVEMFVSLQPVDALTTRITYTYMETEDRTTQSELLRRPRNKAGLDMAYRFSERGDVEMDVVYVGKRYDNDYSTLPARRVELDDYVVVDLAVSYRIGRHIQVFARGENLLDEDYEEVKGYGTPGRSGFGGVRFSF